MNKLYCYNRWLFEEICKTNGWDNDNIPTDAAFISICGTPDCQEYVIQEREFHYFDDNYLRVLNLDFDDISTFRKRIKVPGEKKYCFGITLDDAIRTVEFIKCNLGKDFYIHCRAGHSRSQAIVAYILRMYDGIYDFQIRPENPPSTPNQFVLGRLLQAAKIVGEEERVCFIRNGYTVESIVSYPPDYSLCIHIKELPGIGIRRKHNVWTIDNYSGSIPEIELFSVIENFVNSMKP